MPPILDQAIQRAPRWMMALFLAALVGLSLYIQEQDRELYGLRSKDQELESRIGALQETLARELAEMVEIRHTIGQKVDVEQRKEMLAGLQTLIERNRALVIQAEARFIARIDAIDRHVDANDRRLDAMAAGKSPYDTGGAVSPRR